MIVYVVLHADYGDQGVDFEGVFASQKAAEKYIAKREPDEHERQWWEIRAEPVEEEE